MTCYSYCSFTCQPQHQCSNTRKNKTSHYNIMHQYFSLTAKTVLSQRSSSFLFFAVHCLDRSIRSASHDSRAFSISIFTRDTLISFENLWNIPYIRFFLNSVSDPCDKSLFTLTWLMPPALISTILP